MNFISDFLSGKANGNTYVQVGFLGSLVLGFFVYNYHMEYLYSASSSDHMLLWGILNKGAFLHVLVLAFSFLLYRAIWIYNRRGCSFPAELIIWVSIHFLIFTLLSTLVIGVNTYRAVDGLITKDNSILTNNLDD